MIEFLRRNRVLATAALFLALAAGLVLGAGADRLRNDRLGRLFLEAMAPFQRMGTAASGVVGDAWQEVVGLFQARDEVVSLRESLRAAARNTARLEEVELENQRLRTMLDFRDGLAGDLLAARVIGHDATGLARTLTLNRGESDGVQKGAAVLAPDGIVGHVFLVSPHAARVLLIVDHNSGVDAIVQRTRARGIVEGTVDGRCGLKFVKRTEDLQVGDLVVTSGLDGVFPRSLPVGTIVAVDKKGQGLFQYATVQPSVDFDHLEEVLVTLGPVAPLMAPDEASGPGIDHTPIPGPAPEPVPATPVPPASGMPATQ
jgi:rod shape-determining protein MreC